MNKQELIQIIDNLRTLPKEIEWVEFKHNYHSDDEIGERISALSNSAKLSGRPYGYLIFGIEDGTHKVVGTNFYCKKAKRGNEELEMWLVFHLNPKIDIELYDIEYSPGIHLAVFRIPAAPGRPVSYYNEEYIRIGSITKKLSNFPDKEAKIWTSGNSKPLKRTLVKDGLSESDVVSLLSAETYFDLMKLPMPQTTHGIIERFKTEHFVVNTENGLGITMLGAIVLAKDLTEFDSLRRKTLRIIVYRGKGKVETEREYQGVPKGYAVRFDEWTAWINGQLPANEEIGRSLRREVRMYPEISIRELVANCLIHQNFDSRGFPMVEIYSNRIEISNPGLPLINTERFIDEYEARNDDLADIMRRMGFCEEKGSGMDKVIMNNELYQLPAVEVILQENRTIMRMSAYKPLSEMNTTERRQACYQHACLKYVSDEKMTNQSLRQRFGIDDKNYSKASRIIKETLDAKLIKEDEPDIKSKRLASYVPFWA